MKQLDFTITFDQTDWICYDQHFRIQADTLDQIDEQLETHLQKKYPPGNYQVNMFFDFESFPTWHRQYMPHYFNRELYFNL